MRSRSADAAGYRGRVTHTKRESNGSDAATGRETRLDRAAAVTDAAVPTGLPVWIGMSGMQQADGVLTSWDLSTEQDWPSVHHNWPEAISLETLIER